MMDDVDNEEAREIEHTLGLGEIDLSALPKTEAAANALIERQHATEIVAIAAIAKRQGIVVDIKQAIELAVDPGALGAAVLAAAADRSDATAVVSAAPTPKLAAGPAAAGGSPLLAIARERAEAAERKRGKR
ncbi:hypothetical protein [Chelatococcus asaccharovorans]|uniref:hypothetical protein n=1 Tax=Chelatococcus asaccharovorans TaxID=28210 RepID=UPI00224C68EB|nr:hypothetical protein [Chelatococcus asaccharovorans]CAH1649820.1 conserved hypothetical protein [Chelatococcus asaccharovorans]CAH1686888.1 conserved hypothetical protein [Chelatococcus asaccharovorans]